MGGEAAIPMFGPPFLVGVIILIVLLVGERKRRSESERFLGLGRGRIARGYFGALCVQLMLYIWVATSEGELAFAILYFVVFGVLIMLILTVVSLPLLALLRRYGFASILGFTGASVVLGLLLGAMLEGEMVVSALIGGATGAAFAVAAGLPLKRSLVQRAA